MATPDAIAYLGDTLVKLIWDPADIPYRLSLAYLARLIGIDSTHA